MVVSDKDYVTTNLPDEEAADALKRILANRDNESPTYSSKDVATVADRLRCRAQKSLKQIPDLPKDLPKESPPRHSITQLSAFGVR